MEKNKYHQEIIRIIINNIKNNKKNTLIEMLAGTGKTEVIQNLIKELNSNKRIPNNILIITRRIAIKEQYIEKLNDYHHVKIITDTEYKNIQKDAYPYIILDEIENISKKIYDKCKNSFIISFCNVPQRKNKKPDYSLTIEKLLKDGYVSPYQKNEFEYFIKCLLKNLGINMLQQQPIFLKNNVIRPDFIIEKNEEIILIEVKDYQNKIISNNIISRAISQIEYYKSILAEKYTKKITPILICSCQVNKERKTSTYKEKGILILDISNLLYLFKNNDHLIEQLEKCIKYSINDIKIEQPLNFKQLQFTKQTNIQKLNKIENKKEIDFIKQLEKLPPGKEYAQKYQTLCVDIIKHLFHAEFTKIHVQKATQDKLFIRDMICGLKGTTSFWQILIKHYNSRFIVFEFKNYKEELDQNTIYITEKYLCDIALRNVAIIVSRKGFGNSASQAALGNLRKNRGLILDIKEEDLINMLRIKMNGQDASDYMLEKLQNYLMTISN